MNLQEDIQRIKKVMGLNEELLPTTYTELIKTMPLELKELFFKQWKAKQKATYLHLLYLFVQ